MKFKRPEGNMAYDLVEQIQETLETEEFEPVEKKSVEWANVPIVSTGSTGLDLAISGGRVYEGGIPCCILAEVHGPSGSGKTAILSEVAASAQAMGGDIQYQDPEARLDQEYSRIYGVELSKENYHRPETVADVFKLLKGWETDKIPKVGLTDSLAALTTDLEIDTGDKMGMRRAKEFSAGLRVNARLISGMLWLCSNQEREGEGGRATTPGGKAIPYYASLRIRCRQIDKIESKKKLPSGVEVIKIIGIKSECTITKSTIDDPFRQAIIYVLFGYGIDSIRGDCQYLKDMQKLTSYPTPDGKKYMGIEQAILHIEENDLQKELKNQAITMWHEIEAMFQTNRNRKKIR